MEIRVFVILNASWDKGAEKDHFKLLTMLSASDIKLGYELTSELSTCTCSL